MSRLSPRPPHARNKATKRYALSRAFSRGTERIVSVNYLFGRSFIAYNFLRGIFTSNFRDMENLRPRKGPKNVVSGTEKRSAKIFGKEIRPKVFGKWTKMP